MAWLPDGGAYEGRELDTLLAQTDFHFAKAEFLDAALPRMEQRVRLELAAAFEEEKKEAIAELSRELETQRRRAEAARREAEESENEVRALEERRKREKGQQTELEEKLRKARNRLEKGRRNSQAEGEKVEVAQAFQSHLVKDLEQRKAELEVGGSIWRVGEALEGRTRVARRKSLADLHFNVDQANGLLRKLGKAPAVEFSVVEQGEELNVCLRNRRVCLNLAVEDFRVRLEGLRQVYEKGGTGKEAALETLLYNSKDPWMPAGGRRSSSTTLIATAMVNSLKKTEEVTGKGRREVRQSILNVVASQGAKKRRSTISRLLDESLDEDTAVIEKMGALKEDVESMGGVSDGAVLFMNGFKALLDAPVNEERNSAVEVALGEAANVLEDVDELLGTEFSSNFTAFQLRLTSLFARLRGLKMAVRGAEWMELSGLSEWARSAMEGLRIEMKESVLQLENAVSFWVGEKTLGSEGADSLHRARGRVMEFIEALGRFSFCADVPANFTSLRISKEAEAMFLAGVRGALTEAVTVKEDESVLNDVHDSPRDLVMGMLCRISADLPASLGREDYGKCVIGVAQPLLHSYSLSGSVTSEKRGNRILLETALEVQKLLSTRAKKQKLGQLEDRARMQLEEVLRRLEEELQNQSLSTTLGHEEGRNSTMVSVSWASPGKGGRKSLEVARQELSLLGQNGDWEDVITV